MATLYNKNGGQVILGGSQDWIDSQAKQYGYTYTNPYASPTTSTVSPSAPTNQSAPPPPQSTSTPDTLATIKSSLDAQTKAQTDLYNQQAADQAAKIKAALAAQQATANANMSSLNDTYGAAINSLNTERAKIPGQTTVMNNSASSLGQQTAQKIRTAMAQMGLLQSGESASQALQNDTSTANNINNNNVNQQNLDADYGNKIAAAQQELASKLAAIRDAMKVAQENGDAQSLAIAQDAAAQINAEGAKNALAYQQWANTIAQQNFTNGIAQQTLDNQTAQQKIDNAYRDNQSKIAQQQFGQSLDLQKAGLTGVLDGQQTMAGRSADLSNEAQSIANQYAPQIAQGQIDQQKLINAYQTLVNAGYPAEQAAKIASTYAQIDQGNRQLDIAQQNANSDAAYKSGMLSIDQQNANTDAAKVAQESGSLKMNDLIQRLNGMYTVKDPVEGTTSVPEGAKAQLRAAIIGQGLPDNDTDKLLLYYGLPINK